MFFDTFFILHPLFCPNTSNQICAVQSEAIREQGFLKNGVLDGYELACECQEPNAGLLQEE